MKKYLTLFFLLILFVFAGCSQSGDPTAPAIDNSKIIYFYGDTCPHCKIVGEYFEKNKVLEKIEVSKREVYNDKSNATLLVKKASSCGLSEENLGVPFLWAEGECLMGDEDIIDYFEKKLNENN